jgi:hypothetical protein
MPASEALGFFRSRFSSEVSFFSILPAMIGPTAATGRAACEALDDESQAVFSHP